MNGVEFRQQGERRTEGRPLKRESGNWKAALRTVTHAAAHRPEGRSEQGEERLEAWMRGQRTLSERTAVLLVPELTALRPPLGGPLKHVLQKGRPAFRVPPLFSTFQEALNISEPQPHVCISFPSPSLGSCAQRAFPKLKMLRKVRGAWLVPSVQRPTLGFGSLHDLGVVRSSRGL